MVEASDPCSHSTSNGSCLPSISYHSFGILNLPLWYEHQKRVVNVTVSYFLETCLTPNTRTLHHYQAFAFWFPSPTDSYSSLSLPLNWQWTLALLLSSNLRSLSRATPRLRTHLSKPPSKYRLTTYSKFLGLLNVLICHLLITPLSFTAGWLILVAFTFSFLLSLKRYPL